MEREYHQGYESLTGTWWHCSEQCVLNEDHDDPCWMFEPDECDKCPFKEVESWPTF